MRVLCLFTLLCMISFNAMAGYQCKFSLSYSEEADLVVAEKTVVANEKDMRSGVINDLFMEFPESDIQTNIALKFMLVGWSGEESITLDAHRSHQRKSEVSMEVLSDKVTLRGNDKDTLWFDSYKLDTECVLL
jgi:hypothetical protein